MTDNPNKDEIKKQIIEFVKSYYKQHGTPPSTRTINEKLGLFVYNYFKNKKELLEMAGIPYHDEYDEDELRKLIQEESLKIFSESIKKYMDEFLEKSIKPLINTYFDRFKSLEEKLLSVEEKTKTITAEEKVYELEGSKIKKTIDFSPITLQYYDWYITKTGINISLGQFIDEVIEEHFRECLGVEIGVIIRPGGGLKRVR